MQIVIDISKDIYEDIMVHNRERREGGKSAYYFEELIQNGTPLPKGHGRLIDVSEYFKKEFGDAREFLDKASTIIKADKEN